MQKQQKLSFHRSSRKNVPLLPLYRARVGAFMDSLPVTVLSILLTLVILFLDDFRTFLAPKSADPVFYHFTLAIFVLFSVELLVCSVSKDNYFLQFFFFLDLLATFSLVPDIPYMWDPILGVDSTADPSNPLSLSAAVQASSRASPANRAIKFVRLIRLVRIAKLFELCAKTRGGSLTLANAAGGAGAVAGMRKGHSAVGQHLSEQTTRKVVLLVLLMLFGIPLLQPTPSQQAEEYSLRELSMLSASSTLSSAEWGNEVNFTLSYYPSILYLNVSPPTQASSAASASSYTLEYIDPSLSQYRVSELLSVSFNNVLALFSQRDQSRLTGEYNIVTTLVVLVLLAVGAVLFNRNNHRMVIVPIERMMATIVALQQNPLAKASLASAQAGGIATATADKTVGPGGSSASSVGGSGNVSKKNSQLNLHADDGANGGTVGSATSPLAHTQPLTSVLHNRHGSTMATGASTLSDTHNETGMLERTLEKLTGLLQVGFGEAGSKMIQKCMQLNAEGDLDPLVDGTKMHAIFGFCDIRRFTDATECLKEDVMMYVNEIAAIVHSQVAACDGNPNKNIGDAFLLVWRLPQELETEDIVELQRLISRQGVVNADSGRSSPSNTVTSHPSDWVTPKAGGVSGAGAVRSRAATALVEEGRERADSATESVASAADKPTDGTKPHSLIRSNTFRQNKPSILRHLTGNGFPFSPASSGAHSPSRGHFDLKEALHMLPARHLTPQLRASVSTLADKALVSFIRVIVEINASDELKRYKLNPRIKAAFDDFQVELGFGLHVGWAIEGPIGSRYKIDASYLSPHVNLAETLEGTTKVYGVPLLLSGEMYALLSPFVRAFCRRLDCVKVSGRETPITLYTFDTQQRGMDAVCRGEQLQSAVVSTAALVALDEVKEERRDRDESFVTVTATSAQPVAPPKLSLSSVSHPTQVGRSGSSISTLPSTSSATLPTPSTYASSLRSQFTASPPQPLAPHHYVRSSLLPVLQQHIPLDFFDWHAAGIESYIAGQWSVARKYLERALEIMTSVWEGGDEPTRVVLAYMKESNYVAPDTWAGFRTV